MSPSVPRSRSTAKVLFMDQKGSGSAMESAEEIEKEPRMNKTLSIKTRRKNQTTSSEPGEAATTAEKKKEEEEEEPMSPAARLFHQPGFNCYIIAVMGCGKSIELNVIKSGLEETLVRHPRFCSIPAMDSKEPRWIKTKVDIDKHLVIPKLDPVKIRESPNQAMEDYVYSLTAAGNAMDLSRPLWEVHILDFPTYYAFPTSSADPTSSAVPTTSADLTAVTATVVFRVHHSLGDGISLISLLLACTRKTSDPDALPTLPQTQRPPATKKRSWILVFSWIWALLMLLWNTSVDIILFVASSMFLSDTPTPLKGTEGVEFRQKRIVQRTVSLDDIKEIKNVVHCTINDVLLGVTSAALTRYLDRKYGEKDKHLPANIRLRSTLLVNIRPTTGIHALSELMEGKSVEIKWGNFIGYVILPFPIAKGNEPLDYVRQGKAAANRKKNTLEAIFTYKSADIILRCFGIKVTTKLSQRVLFNTTLSFSNIVGPVDEIAFYGHPLVYIAPTVHGHPQALTVHFQSYMNKMTIVLAVDELAIPEPHQLLDDMAESLKLMKEAIRLKS